MTEEEFYNLKEGDYVYFEEEIKGTAGPGCTFEVGVPYRTGGTTIKNWISIYDEEQGITGHGYHYKYWSLWHGNQKSIYELLELEDPNDK